MPQGVRKNISNMDIMDVIKAKLKFVDRVKDLIVKLEDEIGQTLGSDATVMKTSSAKMSSTATGDAPKRRGRPPGRPKKVAETNDNVADVQGTAPTPVDEANAIPRRKPGRPKKEPTNLPADPENPDSKPAKRRGRPPMQKHVPAAPAEDDPDDANIHATANGVDHADDDGAIELEEVEA